MASFQIGEGGYFVTAYAEHAPPGLGSAGAPVCGSIID